MATLRQTSSTELAASFVWGNDLSGSEQGAGGVGGLLFARFYLANNYDYTPPTVVYYGYDGNGNVTTLYNPASQSVAAVYEYDAFGQILRQTGPTAATNPFRFSTKFTDDESGLNYYGFRYYSPWMGRWISRDPIGERGGENLSVFSKSSAVGIIDRLGLDAQIPYDENAPAIENANTLDGISATECAAAVMDGSEISPGRTSDLVTSFEAYDRGWNLASFGIKPCDAASSYNRQGMHHIFKTINVEYATLENARSIAGPGRVNVQLDGDLTVTDYMCGCTKFWMFVGRITIQPDLINFNSDPTRGTSREWITNQIDKVLHYKRLFYVRFKGGRDLDESGSCPCDSGPNTNISQGN